MNRFPLDHVAVAVRSIADARPLYELLTGDRCSPVETLEDQGVDVAFVGSVELLEPHAPDTPVGRFLDRRGPGLHHVAFRVAELTDALRRLREAGLRLVDETPRPGARGHLVAFLHPESTGGVLVELVEARKARTERNEEP